MKRIAGLLIAAGLVLSGCAAKPEPEPAYQVESFPLAAASWPLQSLLQNLHRQLSPDPDWLPEEASGSTQAAWRSLIQVVNPQPRMILAYEPSAAMRRELQDYDTLWQAQTIGYDALVMITGSENPVDSLSLDQIRDIYSGKITNWNEVGGLDQPIRIYAQDENSGLQTAFERQVMQGVSIVNPALEWVYERAGVVRQAVAAFTPAPDALGFSSWLLVSQVNPSPELKILAVNGVSANAKTLENGKYPLKLPVLLASNTASDATIAGMTDWLLSAPGQRWLSDQGLVPVQ